MADMERLLSGISDWRGLSLLPETELTGLRRALLRLDKIKYAPVIEMIDAVSRLTTPQDGV